MSHDAVLHTASVIAVLLLGATAIALGAVAARRTRRSFPILPLTILTGAIAILLTPQSAFLWNHAPEAALLQFPWRLLAVLAPVLALAIAGLFSQRQPGCPIRRSAMDGRQWAHRAACGARGARWPDAYRLPSVPPTVRPGGHRARAAGIVSFECGD